MLLSISLLVQIDLWELQQQSSVICFIRSHLLNSIYTQHQFQRKPIQNPGLLLVFSILSNRHISAAVYTYLKAAWQVSMDSFRRSQSADSAEREKSSCSGPLSVLFKDQITELLWYKTSLQKPTIPFSDESRYLIPLWVSANEDPREELYQSVSSQSIICTFFFLISFIPEFISIIQIKARCYFFI